MTIYTKSETLCFSFILCRLGSIKFEGVTIWFEKRGSEYDISALIYGMIKGSKELLTKHCKETTVNTAGIHSSWEQT